MHWKKATVYKQDQIGDFYGHAYKEWQSLNFSD